MSNRQKISKNKKKVLFVIAGIIIILLIYFGYSFFFKAEPDTAEYWFVKGVDLADQGKYEEALRATDRALLINDSFPRAHASRSGILVMLGRYPEAIDESDRVLAVNGSLPQTFAVAYYNKGNALYYSGKIEDARVAFAKAHELDPTLLPPNL